LVTVLHTLRLGPDKRPQRHDRKAEHGKAEQGNCADIGLPDFLETFHHQITSESCKHDREQHRDPFAGSCNLVFLVDDVGLDEPQEQRGNAAAQHR
jgi:hypothetical protein